MAWRKGTSFPSAFYGAFLSTAAFHGYSGNRWMIGLIGESISAICSAICAAICSAMHRF